MLACVLAGSTSADSIGRVISVLCGGGVKPSRDPAAMALAWLVADVAALAASIRSVCSIAWRRFSVGELHQGKSSKYFGSGGERMMMVILYCVGGTVLLANRSRIVTDKLEIDTQATSQFGRHHI